MKQYLNICVENDPIFTHLDTKKYYNLIPIDES